ncbi:MAG TPA: nucleoside-diphosphate sugar epimerase/dehydratase [Bryobacteraceae bacterium]|nr:nucleoside-diphosphate sugar epimerase/dehydratase [Bryobacteraceae bacterium]
MIAFWSGVLLFWQRHRRLSSELAHGSLAAAALGASFLLRFEFAPPPAAWRMLATALPVALALKLVAFHVFGLDDVAWRYLGFADLGRMALANLAASALAAAGLYEAIGGAFPRSVYILDFVLCFGFVSAAHAAARMLREGRLRPGPGAAPPKVIFIYGAGKAGLTVLSEIRAHPELGYRVAGFLDDDPRKFGIRLHGTRVFGGRASLAKLAAKYRVGEMLLALPRASGGEITAILDACRAARVRTRKIPPLAELIENGARVHQAREVRLEDLLGRAPVDLDQNLIAGWLRGRAVLVTGAGGSIGGELCRQIARFEPSALVGLDSAETALYEIEQDLRDRFPGLTFHPEVANIQNRRRIAEVMGRHRPSIVFHAAAYKHVPMMEAHVFEALENNVFGTRVVAREAARQRVDTFVLVSSDKAVRPANVMGATKRVAELVCQTAGASALETAATRFIAVRFGNVLGSNGSVIPRFRRQIARGGPVTVTHPDMRRYFMTIPEAAQLVLEAGAMGSGGEIFLLEMGEPVLIVDLARKMILLSGYRPDADIHIEFCGARPGEKLAEELHALDERTLPTRHAQIRIFACPAADGQAFEEGLRQIERAVETRDVGRAVLSLKELIPDYNPSGAVLRLALGEGAGKAAATAGSAA